MYDQEYTWASLGCPRKPVVAVLCEVHLGTSFVEAGVKDQQPTGLDPRLQTARRICQTLNPPPYAAAQEMMMEVIQYHMDPLTAAPKKKERYIDSGNSRKFKESIWEFWAREYKRRMYVLVQENAY